MIKTLKTLTLIVIYLGTKINLC